MLRCCADCRQLDDEFRREYAGLWKALFFADVEGIKDCSMKMNAGELYPLFASMLTMRPWEAITNPNLDHKERLAPPAQDEVCILRMHCVHRARGTGIAPACAVLCFEPAPRYKQPL